MHSLCPFGVAFMKSMWKRTSFKRRAPWAYGCLPNRRREGGVLHQEALRWRLRRYQKSHIADSHDIINAFGSPDHPVLDRRVVEIASADDAPLLQARYRQAITTLQTTDGLASFHHGCGVPQGDGTPPPRENENGKGYAGTGAESSPLPRASLGKRAARAR